MMEIGKNKSFNKSNNVWGVPTCFKDSLHIVSFDDLLFS